MNLTGVAKLRLGLKISGGFAAILVFLVAVGLLGDYSLTSIIDRVEKSDALTAISQQIAEVRRHEKNFVIRRDEKSLSEVLATSDRIKNRANNVDKLFKDPANNQRMEQLIAGQDSYSTAFKRYAGIAQESDKLAVVWRQVGEDFVRITGKDVAEVIQPALAAAYQAKDAEELYKWSNLNNQLSEKVIRNFLLMRVSAIYYLLRHSDQQWDDLSKSYERLLKGLAEWQDLLPDNAALAGAARELKAGIEKYHATALQYRQLFSTEQAASTGMVEGANQSAEATALALEDQKAKMGQTLSLSHLSIRILGFTALGLGIVLAYLLTRSVTRKVNGINSELGRDSQMLSHTSNEVASSSLRLAQGSL